MQHPSKTEIRKAIQLQRKAVSSAMRADAAIAVRDRFIQLALYKQARTIAVYSALPEEFDPQPITEFAWQDGKQTTLPLMTKDRCLQFFEYSKTTALKKNKVGILEVDELKGRAVPLASHDVILIPMIAFDSNCNRIGMGAGYYDKTLAQIDREKTILIAIGYDFQCVKSIVTDCWDIKMDKIITEKSLYPLN